MSKPVDLIILIDANNTCFRVGWANKHLTNNGEPTGVIFGFFKEILAVWKRWKNAKIAVVWDSGYEYRLQLSKNAIKEGIITAEQGYYKQNRERRREKEESEGKVNDLVESVNIQKPTLKKIFDLTLVHQIQVEGCEADDVIGSLAKMHSDRGDIVNIISSDKDMFQLLNDKTSILSISKKGGMSNEVFCGEFGLSPSQWIDIGALAGDSGDNIHGVKGVAEKTAIKMLEEAQEGLGMKRGTAGYRDIITWISNKNKKKKKEERVIESQKIIELAYQLKKIDVNISPLDYVNYSKSNPILLKKWFQSLNFESIISDTGLLTRRSLI